MLIVFSLAALVACDAERLGRAGWRFWQQLAEPPENLDARLVRGLTALYHLDGHAATARAHGDGELARLLVQATQLSRATLVADLEDGLGRWRALMPLLTIAWPATPLARRGLHGRLLRPWLAADVLLERLPRGGCGAILSLSGRMLVVREALRRVRARLTRPTSSGRQGSETLEHDQATLVRAGLECHEMLVRSLRVRREELFGTRH